MITINHNHPSSDLGEVVTIYPRCGAPDPQSGSWSQLLGHWISDVEMVGSTQLKSFKTTEIFHLGMTMVIKQ